MKDQDKILRTKLSLQYLERLRELRVARNNMLKIRATIENAGYKVNEHTGRLNKK
jgi:hypothetical protein